MGRGIAGQRRLPALQRGLRGPQRAAASREPLPVAGVTAGTAPRCSALLPAFSPPRSPVAAARSVPASAGGGTEPPRRVAAPRQHPAGQQHRQLRGPRQNDSDKATAAVHYCVYLKKLNGKSRLQQVPFQSEEAANTFRESRRAVVGTAPRSQLLETRLQSCVIVQGSETFISACLCFRCRKPKQNRGVISACSCGVNPRPR